MGVVVRQSIKGTAMSYIGVLIGFVTTFFILTAYFSTEEVGLTRVLLDASILFSGLAMLGTNTSAIKYYPYFKNESNNDNGFFGWTLILPFCGFLIFTLLFFIFRTPIEAYFSKKSALFVDYLYFVLPLAFCMLYLTVFETNSNLLLRITIPKFIREIAIRILTLGVYLLFAFDIINMKGVVVLLCVVYFIATVLNIIYLLTLKKISFKPGHIPSKLRREILFYTLFLITAAIAGYITPMLNTFFITGKMGLAFTGVYTIASYLSDIVEMPYRSLGAISRPHIAQAMKESDFQAADKLCKNISLHQLLIGSFVFLVIWMNIDLFFSLLNNGEEYAAGKWVFFILGLSKLFNSSLSVGSTVLSYSKYYYLTLIFTAILTIMAILMNIWFIPRWGMEGAALASLLAYAAYYLPLLLLIKLIIGTSPFSGKQLIVVLISTALFASNMAICYWISPKFIALFDNQLVGQLIEAALRTGLVIGVALSLVYSLKISEQINSIINRILSYLRRKI